MSVYNIQNKIRVQLLKHRHALEHLKYLCVGGVCVDGLEPLEKHLETSGITRSA